MGRRQAGAVSPGSLRRALREQWPALSALYGLRPWDADPDNPGCLRWGELNVYMAALADHAREAEAAAARLNERR